VVFHGTGAGREPVREWLKDLDHDPGLWEIRSSIPAGIARVVFAIDGDTMILLHGFVKKSRKTPATEIATSRRRLARLLEERR
jgi:phage-related protein